MTIDRTKQIQFHQSIIALKTHQKRVLTKCFPLFKWLAGFGFIDHDGYFSCFFLKLRSNTFVITVHRQEWMLKSRV